MYVHTQCGSSVCVCGGWLLGEGMFFCLDRLMLTLSEPGEGGREGEREREREAEREREREGGSSRHREGGVLMQGFTAQSDRTADRRGEQHSAKRQCVSVCMYACQCVCVCVCVCE